MIFLQGVSVRIGQAVPKSDTPQQGYIKAKL